MPERRYFTYEALFLFPQAATANLQEAADHVRNLLDRAEAETIAFRKWDERRLAYEIQGNKRGVYFLVYFKAPADKLASLERDCNLSEQMLRALVTRADHLSLEQMQAAEGRQQLADEIKLRAEQPVATDADAEEPSVDAGDEDEEDASLVEDEPARPRHR